MDKGPIFIAGADRSGTTLTYAILVSNPNISITHPSPDFWTFFYKQYGDLSKSENFERCMVDLLNYKPVFNLNPDPERVRKEFWEGEHTYAHLFEIFHLHYARQMGRTRWCDKTSYVERYADPIFEAHPNAKFLHLIRDPRDRYASAIKRWPNSKGKAGSAAVRWLYSVELAERNLKKYPDRYKIIQYENLTSEPEKVVRGICEFLDEEYDPYMLTLKGAETFARLGGNSSFKSHSQSISTASVGRFAERLSKEDIAFVQMYTKHKMEAYGYELYPVDLSGSELASFYLTSWPSNFARMVSWRFVEAIRVNYPNLFGWKPHPNTQIDLLQKVQRQ